MDKINHLIHTMKMSHDIVVVVFWLTKGRKFTTWMSWVVSLCPLSLFPIAANVVLLPVIDHSKSEHDLGKKKLTNFFSLFLLAPQKPMSWLTLLNFVRKKRWEGDNNSAVVPVIKISPLMALALVVVIRSKKRVTTSSSDPFNKIFRRSVVCVSFFFIHSMPELLYTKDFCNSFIHCVWKFFFFNVTRFNKLTCFFLETLIKI